MDDVKTTEMVQIATIEATDLLIISKVDGSATYKMSIAQLADALMESITYANLNTTDKTIVGAINEINGGGQ